MDYKPVFDFCMPVLERLNPDVSAFIEAHGGDALRKKLSVIYCSLEETNEHMNLTSLHGESSVLLHLFDSLSLAAQAERILPRTAKVCDVGCGGGFPSLPLAAALPEIRLTSVDSTAKKLSFVSGCAGEAKVLLNTIPARAEELPDAGYRDSFDGVTARAVARLNILTELCMPLVAVGGYFLPMKTGEDELSEAKNAIKTLGGECEDTVRYSLLSSAEKYDRVIFVIRKLRDAPGYPRKYAKIVKSPL